MSMKMKTCHKFVIRFVGKRDDDGEEEVSTNLICMREGKSTCASYNLTVKWLWIGKKLIIVREGDVGGSMIVHVSSHIAVSDTEAFNESFCRLVTVAGFFFLNSWMHFIGVINSLLFERLSVAVKLLWSIPSFYLFSTGMWGWMNES